MANERNALAELAERLEGDIVPISGCVGSRETGLAIAGDIRKAQRIVAELAKVKLNGVGWPARIELADAYDKCRAIAKEVASHT